MNGVRMKRKTSRRTTKGKRQMAKTRSPFEIKGLKFIYELLRTVRRFAGPSVLAWQKVIGVETNEIEFLSLFAFGF